MASWSAFCWGWCCPAFRGKRSIYSPEWANGALLAEADAIYQALYAHLSAQWVADGCVLHALTVLAHDTRGLDGWYWQGFGLNVVDAVRSLDPWRASKRRSPSAGRRRRTCPVVAAHGLALQQHLASAPIFKALIEPDSGGVRPVAGAARPCHVAGLRRCRQRRWAAWAWSRPIPTPAPSCRIPARISVMHAYTEPAARGQGIAAALLDRAIADGRGTWLRALLGGFRVPEYPCRGLLAAAFPAGLLFGDSERG